MSVEIDLIFSVSEKSLKMSVEMPFSLFSASAEKILKSALHITEFSNSTTDFQIKFPRQRGEKIKSQSQNFSLFI